MLAHLSYLPQDHTPRTSKILPGNLSENKNGIVFLLWGNFAKAKASLIDPSRHHVLMAAHPSPLAGGAFFGCRHFSKTNQLLAAEGKTPINWQL